MEFIKDMDLIEFIEFCNYARKKDQEDRLYQQWCAMLPQFAEYKSFEWFKDQMTGANIDMRSVDEIIADIEETHRKAGMK